MAKKRTAGKRPTPQAMEPTPSKIKVVIVDDSTVFLDLEERWLSSDSHFEIAGRAGSGHEALDLVDRVQPDLVIMDVTMQDLNGLEAAAQMKSRPRPPRIVLLTVEINEAFRSAANKLGVNGYLTKAQLSSKLMPLLQELFPTVG